jgi:hypothetical protein
MPQGDIQARLDAISAAQLSNEFGPQRYAVLFRPGTYCSDASPLNFQVSYYEQVAGLGASPGDVHIHGTADVYNQCSATGCVALTNFWRSLSNLTIDVAGKSGCRSGEFWAASQAAPMRRVDVNGFMTLMDYCTGPSFASGGLHRRLRPRRHRGERLAAAVPRHRRTRPSRRRRSRARRRSSPSTATATTPSTPRPSRPARRGRRGRAG